MRVFVTGGSGFVGGHVIERLARGNHDVRALARSASSIAAVEGFGARSVRGELGSVRVEDLREIDAIIHLAAFASDWGTHEQFFTANVDGTTQMLETAARAGVKRFVHVGTEAAFFVGEDLLQIDETWPYPAHQRYLYSESKAEAERRVLAANSAEMTTISVRPRLVWGPRDTSVLATVVRMARDGGWLWLDGGRARTSTTHVYNAAHGLELALTKGRGGEAYHVTDDGERSVHEFLDALARTQGVVLPERSIPGSIARPLAVFVEGLWRVARIRSAPPMTKFAIAMMSRSVTVNTAKARAELGYTPVISVADGLRAMGTADTP